MKQKICLLGLLCLFFTAGAQTSYEDQGLQTGATVPDILIKNVRNSAADSLRLSSLGDKLVILDFWATYCIPCVAHLPALFALQKKYPGQVQILLVNSRNTRENTQTVESFLKKREAYYKFVSITSDTTLAKLFPHHTLGHSVWIRNNRVLAITDPQYVTEENIKKFLVSRNVTLPKRVELKYSVLQPLFDQPAIVHDRAIYRTVLTGYLQNFYGNFFGADESGLYTRITLINNRLTSLYRLAYPQFGHFPETRCIVNGQREADDPISSGNWRRHHMYTYESIFPPCGRSGALQLFRQDLKRYFGLHLDSEQRAVACFVIRKGDLKQLNIASAGSKPSTTIFQKSGAPVEFSAKTTGDIARNLESVTKMFFADESGVNAKINLTLPADLSAASMTAAFRRQGLVLTRETRPLYFFVLSGPDKPHSFTHNHHNL